MVQGMTSLVFRGGVLSPGLLWGYSDSFDQKKMAHVISAIFRRGKE
jgi:hypothetical protein